MIKIFFAGRISFAVLLLPIIFDLILMQKAYSQMHAMKTGMVTEKVYAIKDSFVNVFLVKSDIGYILIDAGNKKKNIQKGLSELQIQPEEISAIFLTHSDFDHTHGISLFPLAEIYLPRIEEQMITGKKYRFPYFKNKLETKDYVLLDEGKTIRYPGITIKGIHTPGHTPGSMCYIVNDSILFTGDVLKLVDGKARELNHYINMDSKTDIESIRKLSELRDIIWIITAHHGVSRDFEKVFEDWR